MKASASKVFHTYCNLFLFLVESVARFSSQFVSSGEFSHVGLKGERLASLSHQQLHVRSLNFFFLRHKTFWKQALTSGDCVNDNNIYLSD